MGFIFVTNIMSYNMINVILITNELSGSNYVDWKKEFGHDTYFRGAKMGNIGICSKSS